MREVKVQQGRRKLIRSFDAIRVTTGGWGDDSAGTLKEAEH